MTASIAGAPLRQAATPIDALSDERQTYGEVAEREAAY